jgi:hypothetical protein
MWFPVPTESKPRTEDILLDDTASGLDADGPSVDRDQRQAVLGGMAVIIAVLGAQEMSSMPEMADACKYHGDT